MSRTGVKCGSCSSPLDEDPSQSLEERRPCPHCGSVARAFGVDSAAIVTMSAYHIGRLKRAARDRSLPERGVVRFEGGTRVGRDGRLVHREALYDPHADIASERVVDAHTGEVLVDKVESMKAKYLARRRWRPTQ